MSRIQVRIDRLVMRGFNPAERAAAADALKTELARILANPQERASWKSKRTPVLRLANTEHQPGPSGGKTIGKAIARAIGRNVRP